MRRQPAVAVLLCLAGAALVLVAAGRPWVVQDVAGNPLLPDATEQRTGADLVPGLRALGLAGLAAVLALAATRPRGRVVVGVLLALLGAGTVAVAAEHLGDTAWPLVALLGGLLLLAAGALVAVRGPGWPALGRRYDSPTARPQRSPDLWEALDRGEDPTAR